MLLKQMDIANWNNITILGAIIFIVPLISFLLVSIGSNKISKVLSWMACGLILLNLVLSILILSQTITESYHSQWLWIQLADHQLTSGIKIDFITACMLVTVNSIAFLVHVFSLEYMKDDEGYKRYFAFLGLFTFSMLGVVLTDNLLVIFIFWELVGLSSYLLIGHWFSKDSASKAAQKAFVVNRVGDIGFIIGLAIIWSQFQTFDLNRLYIDINDSTFTNEFWIAPNGTSISIIWLSTAGIALFFGAVGKSAQFPLQVWLPDAMEGPTPVSALIHAATMVAAGVYLIARVFVLINVDALTLIAFIGSITAFMGAVAALTQNDIKKVLAYSTISQLGYMVMGLGVGAYDAALFHLFTHAFFKAGLFLAAGSIIHSLHKANHDIDFDTQDMRNMGGIKNRMPITFTAYLFCGLALMGIPFFSGFLSKDAILLGTLNWSMLSNPFYMLIPILGFGSVLLTVIYVARQLLLIFFGEFRGGDISIKENSILIKPVLIILAIFSLAFIWSLNPFSADASWVMNIVETPVSQINESIILGKSLIAESHLITTLSVLILIISGIAYAYQKYKPGSDYVLEYHISNDIARNKWQNLSYNNWYLDRFYNFSIVNPILRLSEFLKVFESRIIDRMVNVIGIGSVVLSYIVGWIDKFIIDGIVNSSVFVVGRIGLFTKSFQSGRVQRYIIFATIGLLIILYLSV